MHDFMCFLQFIMSGQKAYDLTYQEELEAEAADKGISVDTEGNHPEEPAAVMADTVQEVHHGMSEAEIVE